MSRSAWMRSQLTEWFTGIARTFHAHRLLILLLSTVLIVATPAAIYVQSRPQPDRISITNTAGTLTALIEVNGNRVLVGAGPTRSHSADFIGRSTTPWDRDVDLVLIPGWSDTHAVGALGLMERQIVRGIAVVGTPGDDAVWTLLERQAQQDDVPVRFMATPHELTLAPDAILHAAALDKDSPGAWIRLEYHGMRIDFVDAEDIRTALPPASVFAHTNDHVFVNMQSQNVPAFAQPAVLVQQIPFWRDDFQDIDITHLSELDRNERIRFTLSEDELRIPMDALELPGS